MSKPDTCKCCGKWTSDGLRQLHAEHKSIYGVDFDKPISETLSEIRADMAKLRGKLWDVGYRFTGLTERLANIEGLLTCGIVTLYGEIEKIKGLEQVPPQEIRELLNSVEVK